VRAVVISEPGGLEVLGVAARPVRDAGPGEIRIAVKAAGVNPTDIGLRERGAGDDLAPPWVPGMDAAGTVESVGDGVDRVGVGDEVMTTSGLLGRITVLDDEIATLEVSPGVSIRFNRRAIAGPAPTRSATHESEADSSSTPTSLTD